MTETSTEVATVEERESSTEIREYTSYNPDQDFNRLALDVAEVAAGFRLVDKSALLGVPFVVTRIIFRPGFPKPGEKTPGDYVSVECVVASKQMLETEPTASLIPRPLTVYGNEPVVFNDSGTGIRRQCVASLEKYSLANTGKPSRKDENPLDKEYQRWADGGEKAASTGFTGEDFGKAAIYFATRGLRKSEYQLEGLPTPSTTWYFG